MSSPSVCAACDPFVRFECGHAGPRKHQGRALHAGACHAFAPSPEPTKGVVHRIRIVFQASGGWGWTAGIEMMAPTMEGAVHLTYRIVAACGV